MWGCPTGHPNSTECQIDISPELEITLSRVIGTWIEHHRRWKAAYMYQRLG